MNCVWQFILSVIMVLGLSGNLCHVFRSNIKDNVGDDFGVSKSRQLSRELSICPVKYLFCSVMRHRVVNSKRHKLELSHICWTGSFWMGTMKVLDSIFGICNIRYGFPSFFFPWITFPVDKVLYFASSEL